MTSRTAQTVRRVPDDAAIADLWRALALNWGNTIEEGRDEGPAWSGFRPTIQRDRRINPIITP
jgi:hypothetical protein